MGKEPLDLLSEFHRDVVLAGLGYFAGDLASDLASDLAGLFMFFTGDLAGLCFRAAFYL